MKLDLDVEKRSEFGNGKVVMVVRIKILLLTLKKSIR